MVQSYMYPFRGYWGGAAHCHIAVYEHQVLHDPAWTRITQAQVDVLIGETYIAPALDDRR